MRTVCLAVCIAIAAAMACGGEAQGEEALRATAGRPGLCVLLGCGDGAQAVELARRERRVLHALDPDAARVDAARAALCKAGLYGRASVERWTEKGLPYPDHYVNVLVAEGGLPVPDAELQRVLAPGGLAIVQRNGAWHRLTKALPAGMDDWTHQKHGPDGNPVSRDTIPMRRVPDRMRWVSDVLEVWSHALRVAGGRAFLFVKDTVRARDAWNGVLLWEGQYPGVNTSSSPGTAYNRPVVTPERVYVYGQDCVVVIDAATGKELEPFKEAGRPLDFILAELPGGAHVLLCRQEEAVSCLDALTGSLRWRFAAPANPKMLEVPRKGGAAAHRFQQLFAGDGRVFFAAGDRTQTGERTDRKGEKSPVYTFRTRLVGLDIASGKEAWRSDDARLGESACLALYGGGVLLAFNEDAYLGFPTDGKGEPWVLPVRRFSGTGEKRALRPAGLVTSKMPFVCCMHTAGLFWLREDLSLVYGEKEPDAAERKTIGWLGIEPRTGRPVRRVGYPVEREWGGIDPKSGQYVPRLSCPVDRNWSGRCYDDIGTSDCILGQTMEIVGLGAEADLKHIRGVRGQCGIGFIVANNAVYTPPNMCIGCYPMVRGLIAYETPSPRRLAVSDNQRLERGPAFGELGNRQSAIGNPDDWPMYRHGPLRTGCTAAKVAPEALSLRWQAQPGGRLTQPVAAEGRVVVASVDQHRVSALNAASGKPLWQFVGGGRIDTAPTLHEGLVLFGCHDGCVYCLRAEDGKLAWRFNAAPEHRRIVSGEQVESPWPVLGSVLVYDGAVFATAGHYSALDGGLHLWALDPATGAVRFHQVFSGTKGDKAVILPTHWYKHEDHALNNVLLADKGRLRLYDEWGGWEFSLRDGSLIGQLGAIPQPGWPRGRLSPGDPEKADRWPWCGHDRVSIAYVLRGEPLSFFRTLEMDPRTGFSGTRGQFMFFPRRDATGIFLRVRGNATRVEPEPWLVPTAPKLIASPADFAKDTRRAELKAKLWPAREVPLRASAAAVTDSEVLWVGGALPTAPNAPAEEPPTGEVRAISMRTGDELGRWSIPGQVSFEGLCAANGRLFVATDSGRLLCFGPK